MKMYPLFLIVIFFSLSGCSSTEDKSISVMSYNIKYDDPQDSINGWEQRKGDLARLVDDYSPDFLGLQEAMFHQLEFLNQSMPNYSYIGVGRDDGDIKGEFSAILYNSERFRVIRSNTIWLSENLEEPGLGWDAAYPRVCTYGLFQEREGKEEFWVFNTHLDHVGEVAKIESVKLILATIKSENLNNKPVILLGDFNSKHQDPPIQLLMTQLDDALSLSESSLSGPIGTYNGFDTFMINDRIDYVFTKEVKVSSYKHVDKRRANDLHISDHLPVVVSMSF